ncbi:hypothetical protein WYO_0649 [Methylobacterium sp. GXF4]|nr:hypothetical protein WYO_0649 [Methylobacterium sp. GXF4]
MRSERARSTLSSRPWAQPTARGCAKRLRSAGRSVGVRGGMKRSRGCSPSASREWPSKTIRRPGDRGAKGALRHDASRNQAAARPRKPPSTRTPNAHVRTLDRRPDRRVRGLRGREAALVPTRIEPHGPGVGQPNPLMTPPLARPARTAARGAPVIGTPLLTPDRARGREVELERRDRISDRGPAHRRGRECAAPDRIGSDQIVPSIRRLDSGYSTIIRRCSGELFQLPGRM